MQFKRKQRAAQLPEPTTTGNDVDGLCAPNAIDPDKPHQIQNQRFNGYRSRNDVRRQFFIAPVKVAIKLAELW